jgi:putative phosphoribosyl transferase
MQQPRRFLDRRSAGHELAQALEARTLPAVPLVLGLPRGGVPVAYEVAHALHAPLDVLIVRKIGAPYQPELAIGAIASGGIVVRDQDTGFYTGVSDAAFEILLRQERVELERREQAYRQGCAALELQARNLILVDDGLATGTTMLAAVRAVRAAGAASIVVAAPVASTDAVALLKGAADQLIVLQAPSRFLSVGQWYQRFEQTTDAEVKELLAEQRASLHPETQPRSVPP